MSIIDEIDALLPQTQCGECGFKGCRPYAEALARQSAPINKCPPGGVDTVVALGALLQQDSGSFLEEAKKTARAPSLAIIREAECIGCTKCIQACPVDAIIGTAKHMHTVLNHECTGCGLCIDPCPVDCIEMVEQPISAYDKSLARTRFNQRQVRLLRDEAEKEARYQAKRIAAAQSQNNLEDKRAKQSYILNAMARVNAKKCHE